MHQIIDLHAAMARAEASLHRWAIVQKTLADLGVDWVTAGTAPRVKLNAVQVQTNLPQAVMADYIASGLPEDDPWMQHCAVSHAEDKLNIEQDTPSPVSQRAKKLREVFAGHGFRQVCLLPAYGGDRPGGMVLYAQGKEEAAQLRNPQMFSHLKLLAGVISVYWRPENAVGEKFGQKKGQMIAPDLGQYAFANVLSRRECEVLHWLAGGLHSAQIANRMGIEAVTVSKHLQTARLKLGAKTREQALALAMKYGLIHP